MRIRLFIFVVGSVLVLLLVGYVFDILQREDPPWWQPDQMQSQVSYDPNLSDPFFESETWSCHNDSGVCDEKDSLKNRARCFTSFQYDHLIHFCEAKLVDSNKIELFIHLMRC